MAGWTQKTQPGLPVTGQEEGRRRVGQPCLLLRAGFGVTWNLPLQPPLIHPRLCAGSDRLVPGAEGSPGPDVLGLLTLSVLGWGSLHGPQTRPLRSSMWLCSVFGSGLVRQPRTAGTSGALSPVASGWGLPCPRLAGPEPGGCARPGTCLGLQGLPDAGPGRARRKEAGGTSWGWPRSPLPPADPLRAPSSGPWAPAPPQPFCSQWKT